MNRALLEKHFEPEQIKQREGSFGKTLDYIEAHSVIQRLNDAFDGEWSFTMTKYEIIKNRGRSLLFNLTLPWISNCSRWCRRYCAFGRYPKL